MSIQSSHITSFTKYRTPNYRAATYRKQVDKKVYIIMLTALLVSFIHQQQWILPPRRLLQTQAILLTIYAFRTIARQKKLFHFDRHSILFLQSKYYYYNNPTKNTFRLFGRQRTIKRNDDDDSDSDNILINSNTNNKSKSKSIKKEHLPSKVCVVCNRPFTWRKKWERCWDEVTACSKKCNSERRSRRQIDFVVDSTDV